MTAAFARRGFLAFAIMALANVALAAAPAHAATDASARAFIDRLGQQTITILSDKAAPTDQRLARMKALLNDSTDLQYVARIIMGRHWRVATDQQKSRYLNLFDQTVMTAMAERLGLYSGQTFEITGENKIDDKDSMVSTRIIRAAGAPPLRVDWRVRAGDSGYKLIDIVAEGVSLIVTQRSEVDGIVNASGVDGLLNEMQRRVDSRTVTKDLPRS